MLILRYFSHNQNLYFFHIFDQKQIEIKGRIYGWRRCVTCERQYVIMCQEMENTLKHLINQADHLIAYRILR